MIEPKILKGFRDSLPKEEIIRKNIIRKIEDSLSLAGYVPIDTPALEYYDILTGKSGEETEKQIFSFEDAGGRKVGLRFDLTVPLARFVSMYQNELSFPFKRYHIAKVWRGEKPQKGRFREFYQADFDIIGSDSIGSDIETINTIINLMNALSVTNFKIHINDRKLLKSIFEKLNLSNYETQILRIFDKIKKVSTSEIENELFNIGIEKKIIEKLFNTLKIYDNLYSLQNILEKEFNINNTNLEKICKIFIDSGKFQYLKLDLTITRGLDYYTGLVFETFIDGATEYGSVCSGGRYENLVSLFSKSSYPGIGGSIGLDRLLTIFNDKNNLKENNSISILITNFSLNYLPLYFDLQSKIISNNICCEIYPDPEKLSKQFKYADKKGINFVMIIGEEELKNKIIKLKNLRSGEEILFKDIEEVIKKIKKEN
ncbi:MAG: histidine--tRNA ligase [Spirochaetes bacterium]|nr:histidine--tRNA ligase [Spirochaetota bacterium]